MIYDTRHRASACVKTSADEEGLRAKSKEFRINGACLMVLS